MKRRSIISMAGGAIIFGVRSVSAQATPPRARPLVALLQVSAQNGDSVKFGLKDFGYIEGQTISIAARTWGGQLELLPGLVDELVSARPDVIITSTALPTRAAMRSTSAIPIIFAGVGGDPVALGLVRSLARPDANVTGFTHNANEVGGKQVQLLGEIIPRLRRLAVLINPLNPNETYWNDIAGAASRLGMSVTRVDARSLDDLDQVESKLKSAAVGALLVQPDAFLSPQRLRVAQAALAARVPSIGAFTDDAAAGNLISYGPDSNAHYRRVAHYVDKILRGARPSDLPVEQPTRLALVVNLKTAKALGVTIPQSVLVRADRVIE